MSALSSHIFAYGTPLWLCRQPSYEIQETKFVNSPLLMLFVKILN